jgi:hypothetical protein
MILQILFGISKSDYRHGHCYGYSLATKIVEGLRKVDCREKLADTEIANFKFHQLRQRGQTVEGSPFLVFGYIFAPFIGRSIKLS